MAKPVLLTLVVLAALLLAPLIGWLLNAPAVHHPVRADAPASYNYTYPSPTPEPTPAPTPDPETLFHTFVPAVCVGAHCFVLTTYPYP